MHVIGYYHVDAPNLMFIENLPRHPMLKMMLRQDIARFKRCRQSEIEIVDIKILKKN